MFLGIDLGTSAIKVLILDESDNVVDVESASLEVSRPRPLWSEQNPEDWWHALNTAMSRLRQRQGAALSSVKAIGLSGQMHGACLLDRNDAVIRPAILWNDGRSHKECEWLEDNIKGLRDISGNIAMPGFTAPKLVWVREHEPEAFARVTKVLLPKDYLRLRMTGEYASDMSDSAGTLWMNVAERRWSDEILGACGLDESHMPTLYEGNAVTGTLSRDIAGEWGMEPVPVVGGGGDNAAGAVGANVIAPGSAFISLGTSGVYFVSSDSYRANPESAVHAFCHCLPGLWHQMSVILSAASCLSWVTSVLGAADEKALLEEAGSRDLSTDPDQRLLFLPYLSGERTPHNNPYAKGVFFGLTHSADRRDLAIAVLEGVAFAFADAQDALLNAGTAIDELTVIGGGARSALWGKILAGALQRPLVYREGAEVGPAFGAAQLARFGFTGEVAATERPVTQVVEPDRQLQSIYQDTLPRYRALYEALKPGFFSN